MSETIQEKNKALVLEAFDTLGFVHDLLKAVSVKSQKNW